MAPTLELGERVIASLDPDYAPRVGDVIAFHPPVGADSANSICGNSQQGVGHSQACSTPVPQMSSQTFIKRIVAGPGDTLAIVEGRVIRNGELEEEPYATPTRILDLPPRVTLRSNPYCNFPTPVRIPADQYFVLGDSRAESADSRAWGPVPRAWIIGQIRTPRIAADD